MLHVEGSYGVAYAASLEMSKVVIIILIPCTKKKKKQKKWPCTMLLCWWKSWNQSLRITGPSLTSPLFPKTSFFLPLSSFSTLTPLPFCDPNFPYLSYLQLMCDKKIMMPGTKEVDSFGCDCFWPKSNMPRSCLTPACNMLVEIQTPWYWTGERDSGRKFFLCSLKS